MENQIITTPVELVVFDMSGTTIVDNDEVLDCFMMAAEKFRIDTTAAHVNSMMGWSKIEVFRTLWKEKLGEDHPEIEISALRTFRYFKKILEEYYQDNEVEAAPGVEELFHWLKKQHVKIALTTGFYREVTNILLHRLGWDIGLDNYGVGSDASFINISIASDEVENGRPAPDMIFKAMRMLKVSGANKIINIGDTPSDLQAGRAAGCLFSLGITSGSHTWEQLSAYPHDGLLENMFECKEFMKAYFAGNPAPLTGRIF